MAARCMSRIASSGSSIGCPAALSGNVVSRASRCVDACAVAAKTATNCDGRILIRVRGDVIDSTIGDDRRPDCDLPWSDCNGHTQNRSGHPHACARPRTAAHPRCVNQGCGGRAHVRARNGENTDSHRCTQSNNSSISNSSIASIPWKGLVWQTARARPGVAQSEGPQWHKSLWHNAAPIKATGRRHGSWHESVLRRAAGARSTLR